MRPSVKQLLNAFDNLDPPPNRQKAITPKFLRALHRLSGAESPASYNTAASVTAALAIVAFFFATRSCEHTTTPNPGRTSKIHILHVVFRNARKRILPADCSLADSAYVTLTFVYP